MCQIDWAMLLEYLKVFFSWPPVLAIFLFWFIRRFTPQISELIRKIKGLKLPGGSELMLTEKEQQQGAASPPELEFPGPTEVIAPVVGQVNATLNVVGEAHGTAGSPELPEINRTYSPRVVALYPAVDPEPIVQFMHLNPGPALDDYVDKVFQLHCERTFNIIFGTQVLVLVFLENPTLTTPAPGASFATLFNRHIELTAGSNRTMGEFMGFLVVGGFIQNSGSVDGPLYRITEAGREFLQHIRRYYPLQWNSKEF